MRTSWLIVGIVITATLIVTGITIRRYNDSSTTPPPPETIGWDEEATRQSLNLRAAISQFEFTYITNPDCPYAKQGDEILGALTNKGYSSLLSPRPMSPQQLQALYDAGAPADHVLRIEFAYNWDVFREAEARRRAYIQACRLPKSTAKE